ncbi:sulfur carrier protein ThiS [Bacillus sp. 03113]|uniref:sulfur carrier protein ThiS n=1 Tax=Bacillus sp. 03113 TaxID=2578211 RepID=UPI0011411933|nr:sulfur carrier protein ThiS [Bacillus sp. 03113]
MNIQLNGQEVTLPSNVESIQDLLDHYQLTNRIVIVELNKEILKKEQYSETKLMTGDSIELIHFVGGG